MEVCVERIERLLPESAIVFDVGVGGLEGFGIKAAGAELGLAGAFNEASVFKDFEMLGDGGESDVERGRKLVDGAFAGRELGKDGPTGWISEGGEGGGELVGHLSIWLINQSV